MKLSCLAFILFLTPLVSTAAEGNPYIEAGVPASDRAWLARDYADTFEAIRTGKAPLPMLEDPQGKRVLERLTNEENFAFFKNKSLPIAQRGGEYAQLQQTFNSIFKIYIAEANKGKKVHAEAAVMTSFGLRVSALGIDMATEFLESLPIDKTSETRSQGMKQMYGGLMIAFTGAETALGEKDFYSPADISLILHAMHSTLPTMQQAFTPDYKLELKKKLTDRKAAFAGEDVVMLEDMIKILDSQPGNEKPPSTPPK